MGYYVILHPGRLPFESRYVDKYEELVLVEGISKEAIVYESGRENVPQRIGDSFQYRDLGEEWYRAGLRAQLLFARLARKAGFVLEELSQDQKSFRSYAKGIEDPVKRGDFLVRNLQNLEVEVKCRSFYDRGEAKYFNFSAEDLQKHLNMQRASHTRVVVAVFRRKEDHPMGATLSMITIDKIQQLIPRLETEEKPYGRVFHIPLKETEPGFGLLKSFKFTGSAAESLWREEEVCRYDKWQQDEIGEPYVLVAYYRNQEHLDWITTTGWYNVRIGMDRGALCLGANEMRVRYILLHTKRATSTDKLFRLVESGPRVFPREMLVTKRYPGRPSHDFYLVYRINPVKEERFKGKTWDISRLKGFEGGHRSAYPFTVPLAELMGRE